MLINFFFHDRKPSLKKGTSLKKFIKGIFAKEGFKLGSLSFVFCSDEFLLSLNQDFLKHDYYTDILTFNLSISENMVNGEIYISVDRVKENAKKLNKSLQNELHRVIFHGSLHLCGYRDKSKGEKNQMRKKEDYYLGKYFGEKIKS